MLNFLKKQSDKTTTENGAAAYSTTGSCCLDLFFRAGAMRNTDENEIAAAVIRAYAENPVTAMKIIFFARDVRGGLGERRFFRIAVKAVAKHDLETIKLNIPLFAEYGRFDDLCVLLGTPCEGEAVKCLKAQLDEDIVSYKTGGKVSLLAKWLPSVNASSEETKKTAKKLVKAFGMSEREYRITLSALRKYTDILENRLRIKDYSFDYSKQPSCAMLRYKKAFIRNDNERYFEFLNAVSRGERKLNTAALYPYDIVRKALDDDSIGVTERRALDVTWNKLPDYGNGTENSNAIAVIDGSGSMTWGMGSSVRPIDAALSLGIYFAEHNKGAFGNHFITFSKKPRLVEIKGNDITEKVRYCATYNECANTDLEAVFELVLSAAVNNRVPAKDMVSRMYIISDMEFDYCIEGGNSQPLFETMKRKYALFGYKLPDVIFWNVNSRQSNFPVTKSETGAALVSGFTPALFDSVMSGNVSPEKVMNDILSSERYAAVRTA